MICVRIVWWIFWRGVVAGALLGALFGTILWPVVGTIYGLFFGGLIGVIMGAVDAFALGATAHFFVDMDHPSRIVPWLRLIGILLTFIGVSIVDYLLFGLNVATFVPSLLAASVVYVLVPRFVKFAVEIQQIPTQSAINAVVTG